MSRVLVTGGNGFIGRQVSAALQRRGHEVRLALRHSGSARSGMETVVVGDLAGALDWSEALTGCDEIVHLAGRAHIIHERAEDPEAEFMRVNRDATLSLARAAARCGVGRFVFVSSIAVNGKETFGRAFSAEDPPMPTDAYGQSKWEAERGLFEVGQRTGLEVVVVRAPLVYGPAPKGNLARLLSLLTRGLPLPLGGLRNRRSLVSIGNLTELLLACLQHPAAVNQVFLASDGHDLSTTELVSFLAAGLGKRARLLPVPVGLVRRTARLLGREGLAQQLFGSLQVDSSKAGRLLGWAPSGSIEAGLREVGRSWMGGVAT